MVIMCKRSYDFTKISFININFKRNMFDKHEILQVRKLADDSSQLEPVIQ